MQRGICFYDSCRYKDKFIVPPRLRYNEKRIYRWVEELDLGLDSFNIMGEIENESFRNIDYMFDNPCEHLFIDTIFRFADMEEFNEIIDICLKHNINIHFDWSRVNLYDKDGNITNDMDKVRRHWDWYYTQWIK